MCLSMERGWCDDKSPQGERVIRLKNSCTKQICLRNEEGIEFFLIYGDKGYIN